MEDKMINQLNNILLEGTTVNDPEVVATSLTTKKRLVKFNLANDQYWLDRSGNMQQDTLFSPIPSHSRSVWLNPITRII